MPGSDLQRYDLVEQLATGGMGEVFLGRAHGEHGFHKMVAVKRIRPELASSPAFVVRFVAEAKLSVQLSHANVVQVFDLGRVGDDLLLVMEYVHGADLGQLNEALRRRGQPMPVPFAVFAAIEALKGLCHAHEAGVIHCDVSPSNLLLSYAGEVKIADFGVAQALDFARRRHKGGRVMGKLHYMAPEQLRGEPLDARTDLYALAVLLHETLSGRRLFSGEAQAQRAIAVPLLSTVRSDVPEALDDLIQRTLACDPAGRPASARVLLGELTRVAWSLPPVTAPDVGTWVRGLVPPREEAAARTGFDGALRQLLGGGTRAQAGTLTALPAARGTESFVVRQTGDGATVWTRVEPPAGTRRLPRRLALGLGLGLLVATGVALTALAPRKLPAAHAALATAPAPAMTAPAPAMTAPATVAAPTPPVAAPTPPVAAPAAPVAAPTPPVAAPAPAAARHARAERHARGWLSVYAEPWAYVFVDGKRVGPTPLMKHEVAAGAHQLRLEHPGIHPRLERIKVRPGQTQLVNVDLGGAPR
jgi:serine/threonine-protein kinase